MAAVEAFEAPALCWRGNGDAWEVYLGSDGWRWRRITPAGELAEHSEIGHSRKRDCFAHALARGMRCAPM
jgi:hypothetical protein